MIELNKRTQIRDAHNQPPDFPKYTFSLTPIENLPDYVRSRVRFLDVIGKIIGVSDAAMVYTKAGDAMMRRVVHLQDLKYVYL
uniref:Uncharacterized protein n=1 Tax=Arundo donax TaxID=35708 RepID=A0A0A9E7E5_ARUDO